MKYNVYKIHNRGVNMGKKLCVIKKDKLYVYEMKTSLRFYKIKEEILKKGVEHINGIYNFNIDKLDYFKNNEEVKIENDYVFLEEKKILQIGNNLKMYYRGYKYPTILNLALAIRDGNVVGLKKLNEFRAPQYIHKMSESKKKNNLLKKYPYDCYVDLITNCFSLKKIKVISYRNMEELIKNIEDVTKYNSNFDCGDKDMFDIAKRAELSMFTLDDYAKKDSGISLFKKTLLKHKKIYEMLKEATV